MTALKRWRSLAIGLALMWAVAVVNALLGHRLNAFGILPRDVDGLVGIALAPFLHGGFSHVASNTAGLLLLGGLVAMRGERSFVAVSVFVALVGGLATWLFARSAYHVGASLVVFGYFGYLLARGVVERTPGAIAVALLVIAAYGGLLWGVLPARGVSFEGHLFGMLAGIGAASLRIGATNSGQHE